MYVIWDPESPHAGSASKAPWTNQVEFSCRCNDSGILKLLQDPQAKAPSMDTCEFQLCGTCNLESWSSCKIHDKQSSMDKCGIQLDVARLQDLYQAPARNSQVIKPIDIYLEFSCRWQNPGSWSCSCNRIIHKQAARQMLNLATCNHRSWCSCTKIHN
jgi:hypothetical protein